MLGGKQISGRKIPLKSAHQHKHIHSSTFKYLHYPSERFFTISWLFALLTVNRQFLFVNEVTHQNHRPKALENCAPPAAKRLGWAIVAWTHWKYNNNGTGKHYSPVLRQRKLPIGRYATWSILRANIAEMCWPPFSCKYNVHYLIWKMNEFDFELQWNPMVHCGLMGNLRKFVKFQVLIVLHLYNNSV